MDIIVITSNVQIAAKKYIEFNILIGDRKTRKKKISAAMTNQQKFSLMLNENGSCLKDHTTFLKPNFFYKHFWRFLTPNNEELYCGELHLFISNLCKFSIL